MSLPASGLPAPCGPPLRQAGDFPSLRRRRSFAVVCEPDWEPRRPSPPWAIGSPDSSSHVEVRSTYVDKGAENYERRYRNQQIQSIGKKAKQIGLQLMDH